MNRKKIALMQIGLMFIHMFNPNVVLQHAWAVIEAAVLCI
jgi:hypothetical protein